MELDRAALLDHLQRYLDEKANLPGAVVFFDAYDIEVYNCPCCGDYMFASIVHTA